MTLYEFNAWPYEQQLATVFESATFLARRWEDGKAVQLYHLPSGIFVELYYDADANEIVWLRSFISSTQLASYAEYIRLP